MKWFLVMVWSLASVSCNTAIGVYRDGRQACEWIGGKLQGDRAEY